MWQQICSIAPFFSRRISLCTFDDITSMQAEERETFFDGPGACVATDDWHSQSSSKKETSNLGLHVTDDLKSFSFRGNCSSNVSTAWDANLWHRIAWNSADENNKISLKKWQVINMLKLPTRWVYQFLSPLHCCHLKNQWLDHFYWAFGPVWAQRTESLYKRLQSTPSRGQIFWSLSPCCCGPVPPRAQKERDWFRTFLAAIAKLSGEPNWCCFFPKFPCDFRDFSRASVGSCWKSLL